MYSMFFSLFFSDADNFCSRDAVFSRGSVDIPVSLLMFHQHFLSVCIFSHWVPTFSICLRPAMSKPVGPTARYQKTIEPSYYNMYNDHSFWGSFR